MSTRSRDFRKLTEERDSYKAENERLRKENRAKFCSSQSSQTIARLTAENDNYKLEFERIREEILRRPSASLSSQVMDSLTEEKNAYKLVNERLLKENIALTHRITQMEYAAFVSKFVEDFTLRGILGEGTFGCVFEAENRYDGCTYAVKRIAVDPRDEDIARALKEVKALAQLEHTGIVRYNGMWFEQPPKGWQHNADLKKLGKFGNSSLNLNYHDNSLFIYIQMQLCSYSLEKWLEGNMAIESRPLLRMKTWFKQITTAVDYIHESNLIHRDLKPSNILFADENRLKICDLGIATERRPEDRAETVFTRTMAGTRMYMSPEQKAVHGQYSSKTDVFSLGLILAELCLPMSNVDRTEIFDNYRRGVQCEAVDDALTKKFIDIVTRVDPKNRPSCKQMLECPYLNFDSSTRF